MTRIRIQKRLIKGNVPTTKPMKQQRSLILQKLIDLLREGYMNCECQHYLIGSSGFEKFLFRG
jgi:hypothetical protein